MIVVKFICTIDRNVRSYEVHACMQCNRWLYMYSPLLQVIPSISVYRDKVIELKFKDFGLEIRRLSGIY